jgi:hypothetical protein
VEPIVVPKVVYNNPKEVKDVVVGLLSVKRDSDFAPCFSDRFDDFGVILRKFVYNPFSRYIVRLRY